MIEALVPYDQANLVENAYDYGRVFEKEYREEGIFVRAELVPEMRGRLAKFEVS